MYDQFLGSAVQQADVRIDALDHLAVELEHEAQYAVRGRVLRPEIDGEIAERRLVHPGSLKPVGPAVAVLRQVRQKRQVRRRGSPAQVWLIGYALLHRQRRWTFHRGDAAFHRVLQLLEGAYLDLAHALA